METIAFCAAIVGVALVIFWYVKTERQGLDRPTSGWFAMREPRLEDHASGTEASTSSKREARRRHGTRASAGSERSARPTRRSS